VARKAPKKGADRVFLQERDNKKRTTSPPAPRKNKHIGAAEGLEKGSGLTPSRLRPKTETTAIGGSTLREKSKDIWDLPKISREKERIRTPVSVG